MEEETPTEKILGQKIRPGSKFVLIVINVSGTKYPRDLRARGLNPPPVIPSPGSGLEVAKAGVEAGSICPLALEPSPSLSLLQTSILGRKGLWHLGRGLTKLRRKPSYTKCFFGWVNSHNERLICCKTPANFRLHLHLSFGYWWHSIWRFRF